MRNGSDVYIYSGYSSNDQVLVKYDILTNTWSTVTTSGTKPTHRYGQAGAYIDGYLYIFGGYTGSYANDTHKFNISTSTWSGALSPAGTIPTARQYMWLTCCECGGKLYVIGGNGGSWLQDAYAYTPDGTNGTWATLAAPTYATVAGAATSYNGYVYLVCGGEATKNYLLKYDPIADSWTTLAPCPNKAHYFTLTSTDDGNLHVFGGLHLRNGAETQGTSATKDIWCSYNITEDRWYAKPPTNWIYELGKGSLAHCPTREHSAVAYNSKLYMFYPYVYSAGNYKPWTICISNTKIKRYMVAEVEYGV
jgi:N-acetylneuraminic acid mutarotase